MDEQLRFYRGYFETRGTPTKIIGRIPYNSKSEQIDYYYEILKPGVFADSLKSGRDVKAYWNHDRSRVIGSTKAGTLKLQDTATGLKIELDPGQTSWGKDALEAVRRGDVSGFSFAFTPVEQQFSEDYTYRYILKANLFEVSPTPEPAYSGSTAYARSKVNDRTQEFKKYFGARKESKMIEREKKLQEQLDRNNRFWLSGREFRSIADQFKAVKAFAEIGHRDPRLRSSGLNELTGSEGGFLLQDDFSHKLIKGPKASEILDRCFQIPLGDGFNSIDLPRFHEDSRAEGSFLAGLRFYWPEQGEAGTYSHFKVSTNHINLTKCVLLIPYTEQLAADVQAFDAVIRETAQVALNWEVEKKIIRGTGSGEPLGIMSAGCTIVQEKETQNAKTIVAANVEKMLEHAASIYNSVWIANKETLPELAKLETSIGTGGGASPLFRFRSGGERYHKLAGLDVLFSEHAAPLGSKGDLILANLNDYIVVYKEAKKTVSMHVLWDTDEELFRLVFRWNGQPTWAKAVTPAQSSTKISPFVVLSERA
jgi:HK97 family phage major capsid protein/HK97 family phage prohead protease